MEFKAICDIGCVRANNEDMAFVNGRLIRDGQVYGSVDVSQRPVAFAVADGMGGYEGGEVASEIVCRSFGAFMKELPETTGISSVKDWAVKANALVLESSGLRPELSEMGATFVALIFNKDDLWLVNIGDSRCYRIREGILKQMSTDHSERERTGKPDVPSNLIYNYMGNAPSEFISDISKLSPVAGDVYILCSDGLSDLVSDDDIELLSNSPEELVEKAKEAGGRDNITVIRIQL